VTDPGRSIFAQVRSISLIGIVTVIIWLLAESESLRTEKVRVEIQLKADPETTHTIRVSPNQEFSNSASIRLEGSNSRVDALAVNLRKPIVLELGMEGFPIPAKPGEQVINLETALKAVPFIRDSGVSISDVEPATATMFVDSLTTCQVPVKVIIPEGQQVVGPPEATPPKIDLTYPESAFKDIAGGPDFTVIARLDAASLATLPAGRRGTINNISLELPEQLWPLDSVRINPSQVSVIVQLRSQVDVYTVPAISVQLRMPVDATGKYDLDTDTTELKDVSVVGPLDLIDQIKSGKLIPVATVPLSAQELEKAATTGQVLTKDPIFSDIPTPLSFDPKQKLIRILVRKRDASRG
jgi:hypothetical protein